MLLPVAMFSSAVSLDGLLLDTLHWYCPPIFSVTVRVWVYCAVTGSSNIVIPPETVSESLVQVTVVAGPPVEMQVRVKGGFTPLRSEFTVNVIPPCILISPAEHIESKDTFQWKSISCPPHLHWHTVLHTQSPDHHHHGLHWSQQCSDIYQM